MINQMSSLNGKEACLKWMCAVEWQNKKIMGLNFFAEVMVTGSIYLDMLQLILEPQFIQDGIFDTVVF